MTLTNDEVDTILGKLVEINDQKVKERVRSICFENSRRERSGLTHHPDDMDDAQRIDEFYDEKISEVSKELDDAVKDIAEKVISSHGIGSEGDCFLGYALNIKDKMVVVEGEYANNKNFFFTFSLYWVCEIDSCDDWDDRYQCINPHKVDYADYMRECFGSDNFRSVVKGPFLKMIKDINNDHPFVK